MGRRRFGLLGMLLVACGGHTSASRQTTDGAPGWNPGTRYPRGSIATYGAAGIGISVYPPNPSASTDPLTTIEGSWHEDACEALAFDAEGLIYAVCYQAVPSEPPGRVVVFASGATGMDPPIRIVTGPNTGITGYVTDGVVDDLGFLYVVRDDNHCNGAVLVFAPGTDGDTAPVRTIFGPDTGLNCPASLAVDSARQLYVGNAVGAPILVFSPSSDGNIPPVRRLGSPADVGNIISLAVTPSGDVLVGEAEKLKGVAIYDADAAEGDSPKRTIAGAAANIDVPEGVEVDAEGHILVSARHGVTHPGTLAFFSPDASGNASPQTVLSDVAGMDVAVAR